MEGGNRPSGAWAGKMQPSREQAQIQPTTMQQYSQVPSFQVSTPQQHQRFAGGVTAGQSPTAPQLPGFGRSFQQQTLTGVVAPSPPQPTGQMFISNNVAHLPGSAPMGDVMHNQQNLQSPPPQQQQQSAPQMMRYPAQLSHQQKGWQEPRTRQNRRHNQPSHQQRQQQFQQPRPHQNHPQRVSQNQRHPKQQQQQQRQVHHQHQHEQAGDEAMEVVTTATPAAAAAKKSVGVGGAVRNQNKQGRQALRRDRMAPGGASVELQKYHQPQQFEKWATSAAFEMCAKMTPPTRPAFTIHGGTDKKMPPFIVHVSVNGVDYSPATAQSVRIARQLASVNFVRELVGGRPTAIDINSLKTGVTSAADHPAPPKATLHHSQQLQQHGFLPSAKVEVDGGTLETSPACPPSPASVPGDYSGGEEEAAEDIDGRFSGGAGGEAGSGTGSSGDCGKRKLSEGGGAQAKRMTPDATTPKMEMSAFSDESPAAAPEAMKASVSTPNRNTLEFQRMHPGGVELRSLHNFKVENRPAVTVAHALCGLMNPQARPEFHFLGDSEKGYGPFTMQVTVNGVKYSPGTGKTVKVAKFEASVNFIREVVGNRKQLDYGSFQAPPPPVAPVHPDADANVEQEIVDNKEATGSYSPSFLKLLHDLVTALPATDSYTAFEWIDVVEQPPHAQQPGDSAGDSTGDGATTNLKIEVDVKKEGDEDGGNDNSGPAEPSNETFGNSCGENKGSRFRCVAKLKLRVDEIEGGPKRSREMKAAKRILNMAEMALSSSPDDDEALERWKSAQDKMAALKTMPAARVDVLTVTKESSNKRDAKIEAARAMAYKLVPESENDDDLRVRVKAIINEHREDIKGHSHLSHLAPEVTKTTDGEQDEIGGSGSASTGGKQGKVGTNGGWTMLMATLNNEGGEIDRLVAEGASVAKQKKFWRGKTLLHLASERGCPDAAEALLRHGAEVNSRDKQSRTSLHLAAERGHLAVVRALLAAGADVLPRHGDRDCSAMDEAVCKGYVEVVEAIILAGADPDAGDCTRYRALHRAAYENQAASVKALLDRGVEIDPRDDDASTPVHFAAQQGSINALLVLLEHGADPNAVDGNQDSPLHLAGLYLDDPDRLFEVVEALLRWGANENALNTERKRPIDLVMVPSVVTLLQRAPSKRRDGRWQRRGLLVLCRSRVRPAVGLGNGDGDGGSSPAATAAAADVDETTRSAKLAKTESTVAGESSKRAISSVGNGKPAAAVAAANPGDALEWVVKVREDKIFRAVVGFL